MPMLRDAPLPIVRRYRAVVLMAMASGHAELKGIQGQSKTHLKYFLVSQLCI